MATNGILLGQNNNNNNKSFIITIAQDEWIKEKNIYKANINNNFDKKGCFIIKPIDNISDYLSTRTFLKEISGQNFIFYSAIKPSIDYQISILYLFDNYQKIINIFNNNNYQNSFIEETYLFPSDNISFSNQGLTPHANGPLGTMENTLKGIEMSTNQNSNYTWGGVQGISSDKIDFSLYNKLYIKFNFSFTQLASNAHGAFLAGITEGINTDTYDKKVETKTWVSWWHYDSLNMTQNFPGFNKSQNYPSIVTAYQSQTTHSITEATMEIDVSSINKEAYLVITNTACGGTTKVEISKIFLT